MAGKVADFSGWATKAGLKCADGRTIMRDAFAEQHGVTVPLVWQHGHNDPKNVLGHAVLYNRPEGVYCEGYFNESEQARDAKVAVQHKDITQLSIYANKLVEKAKQVFHGKIREVSLVLAGANPGALIENVTIAHGDGLETELEEAAVIYTGLELELEHSAASAETTLEEVWDSMSPEQQKVVEYMVGAAVEAATEASAKHADSDDNPEDEEEEPGDDPGTETVPPADAQPTETANPDVPDSNNTDCRIESSLSENASRNRHSLRALPDLSVVLTLRHLVFPDAGPLLHGEAKADRVKEPHLAS